MSTSERKRLPVPIPAPVEYAGQWVAWNNEQDKIIAHGERFGEVRRAAIELGYPDAVLQRVRRPDLAVIGGA